MSMPTCPSCIYAQGICKKTGVQIRPTTGCSYHAPKPITNADRIRAMTDEKLAEWLAHYTSWTEFGEKMAKERWLIYLRQEVTND